MKKKTVAVLMTMLMTVGMMAGCGSTETSTTGNADVQEAETQGTVEAEAETQETVEMEAETQEVAEETVPELEDCEILVAAAASLKNAYEEELIPMFYELYPNVTVTGTYDSSGKLQTQIEEGLEADIFMSAATKQMNALIDEELIDSASNVELLENKIVLIVPTGSEADFTSFESIADADSIALGDPESVPAGQYAKEALTNLELWDAVSEKTSFATNVTEVLNQVAAGSASAGIVYATDAASMSDQVSVVAEAPEGSLETPVIYPVAVVKNTAHPEAAEAFLSFLQTPEALAVFEKYGFTINVK